MPGPSSSTHSTTRGPGCPPGPGPIRRGPPGDVGAGELAGVLEEVGQQLVQAVGIGHTARGRVAGPIEGDGQAGRRRPRGRMLDRPAGHLAGIDVARLDAEALGLEPGQVEQVAHRALEPPGLGVDDGHAAGDVVGGAVGQGVGVAADGGERGAQLVGDRQQEVALLVAGPLRRSLMALMARGQRGELGHVVGETGMGESSSPPAIRSVASAAVTSGREKRRASQ